MQRLFLLLITVLTLSSCGEDYIQVVYTKPATENIKSTNRYYVYENDKVKVYYDFWALGGMMRFAIYNKHDKPIYIDWSKSSFIKNGQRLKYYHDREYTSGVSVGLGNQRTVYGAYTDGLNYYPGTYSSSTAAVFTNSTRVKEERVTFIPPHSSVVKTFGNISHGVTFSRKDVKVRQVMYKDMPMYEITPKGLILFRNFLTYSTSRGFINEEFVDNGFKISKIRSMKTQYFSGSDGLNNTYPFYRPSRFYINYMYIKQEKGEK